MSSAPANTAMAADRAHAKQETCTLGGRPGCCATRDANALARQARRHGSSQWNDMPDGAPDRNESVFIMGAS